jgi:hypothetical protein
MWHAARLQVWLWLDRTLRTAAGTWHECTPTVRRGQWVRFVGNPAVVQTPDGRPPRRGVCGQVLRRWPGGSGLTVVFVGAKSFANLRADDVEPLVGTPPGCPRDHLRRFRRRMKARWRASDAARAPEQVGSGTEPADR